MPESKEDEEIRRKIDELRKDPEKWEDYIASRLDRAVKNWRTLGEDRDRLCDMLSRAKETND